MPLIFLVAECAPDEVTAPAGGLPLPCANEKGGHGRLFHS
jgi:hypothetical protein